MRPSLFSEALREAPDEVLENITTVYCTDLVWTEIAFRAVELFDGPIQCVALHHALDDVIKVELGKNVLHIWGEAS